MHRIQVQLTPEQERMLREMASARGSSISALIREGIDALLAPEAADRTRRQERMLSIIGIGRSAPSDGPVDLDEEYVRSIEESHAAKRLT
jgi:Arc/MetJ-type ribon-helix-helix transcriptional regulator